MRVLDALGDWIDQRTSWKSELDRRLEFQSPRAGLWLAVVGAAAAACVLVLVVTGVLLMTAYAPSPQTAWASVHYVQFVQKGGWIVRGLHFWAAQTLVVVASVHVCFGALAASYRPPREIGWWAALLFFGVVFAELITGGLLPWDQRGWWGRVVESNIIGLAPVIGGWLSRMIAGGTALGALGLERAYTAHVLLLPLIALLALWVHFSVARRFGLVPPSRASGTIATVRLVARAVVVGAVVVCALFAVTGWKHGVGLQAPADPLSDYPARPEWFLMPLFRLRKSFHGSMEFWGTTMLPAAAAAYLALLPWIDRRPLLRLLAAVPVLAIFGGAVWLGADGIRHDAHDSKYLLARAKWDRRAAEVNTLAMNGVPPDGALAMEQRDPELHGHDLFEAHCASCHVLGDMGDKKKATATRLDGWGTPAWIEAMIHDPDAPQFFGRGPYKGQMPSVDVRPKDKPAGEPWKPMIKNEQEREAVALFLSAQGAEPGDPPPLPADPKLVKLGEGIVSDRCTTCHLYKGDGDDEGSGLAPELSGYGSLAWTRAQVQDPSSTKVYREKALGADMKRHMPRFDKELSPSDIAIVARYVREQGRSHPSAM